MTVIKVRRSDVLGGFREEGIGKFSLTLGTAAGLGVLLIVARIDRMAALLAGLDRGLCVVGYAASAEPAPETPEVVGAKEEICPSNDCDERAGVVPHAGANQMSGVLSCVCGTLVDDFGSSQAEGWQG